VSATARNIVIVLLLAAAVAFLPGAGIASGLISYLLSLLFLGGMAFFVARLYMEHRLDLDSLGERRRAMLYGAVGVAILTVSATPRLWNSGPGTFVWFLLIGLASYVLYLVYRSYRDLA
jgi:uncharacterized membrane-anchored protein